MVLEDSIYIFNLCEFSDIPLRTILRLYDAFKDETITADKISDLLGNTPTCSKIIERLETLDCTFLSLYSLVSCGINQYIVETLKESFSSIKDISDNPNKLVSYHFQDRTLNKILEFVKNRVAPMIEPKELLKSTILDNLASREEPIKKNDLFVILANGSPTIAVSNYFDAINDLARSGKIKITNSGIELKRVTIQSYFNDFRGSSRGIYAVELYINGKNIQQIADMFSVTRQRVDQLIKNQIPKNPLFDNELKYLSLMKEYHLSDPVMERLGFGDKELANYIKLKYCTKPEKNDIDYVIDINENGQNLIGTDLGNYILNENKLAFINGKLLKRDFRSLFVEFISLNNLVAFNLADAIERFKSFLKLNSIDLQLEDLDFPTLRRKVENIGVFLNCGSGDYYWFDTERISNSFLDATRSFLESFYGFCSVDVFLKKNRELCEKEFITNEYQLFSVLKKLYCSEFFEDIDFIRMPTLSTKGLKREEFFEGLISDLQPVKVQDFLDYVSDEYGFNKASLYANMYSFFNQYIDKDGLLRLNAEPIDPNDEDVKTVLKILNNRKVIPLNEYIDKIRKTLPQKADYYTSKYIIKKFGYSYRNDSIYMNCFDSLFEAMLSVASDLPMAIPESKLLEFLPLEALNTRYSMIKQEALFLKFSDSSYLNVIKRIDREELLRYRDEIIDSLIPDEVYTLGDMMTTVFFNRISDKYSEITKMFEAMNYKLLVNLLKGSLRITSLESDDPFVFGTGALVSNKQVVKCIVKERRSIDKTELIDLLNSKYGINHDYWNSFFFELGLYYNNHTDKVYISKERCDQELQDYLNEEGLK